MSDDNKENEYTQAQSDAQNFQSDISDNTQNFDDIQSNSDTETSQPDTSDNIQVFEDIQSHSDTETSPSDTLDSIQVFEDIQSHSDTETSPSDTSDNTQVFEDIQPDFDTETSHPDTSDNIQVFEDTQTYPDNEQNIEEIALNSDIKTFQVNIPDDILDILPDSDNETTRPDIVNDIKETDGIVFYDSAAVLPPVQKSEENTQDTDTDKTLNKNDTPKRKFKISKKHLIINIIGIIMSAVLIVSGSLCIVAYSYFNRINYEAINGNPDADNPNHNSPQNSSVNDDKVNAYNGTLLNDDMVLNIMLFGADTRKNATIGQSDTMILFSIDTRHRKLKMLSLMRDTYVEIPGYDNNKMNASYTYGGASLAVQTVQRNYGIKIDRYAVVDFKSFRNIIDTLGGIDIQLTSEEIDYINWQSWTNNQVETRYELDVNDYSFVERSEGVYTAVVHLNGRQALWHARNRGEEGICSGDDYTRTLRQRNVVSILIDRLKQSDFATVMSIIYEIGPMITTNLKTSEITSLAAKVTTYLKYDIVSASAPAYDSIGTDFYYDTIWINGDPLDCIIIYDWNDFRRKVAEFIFEEQLKTG